ncbi:hypothetical protein L2K70_04885 [Nocardioides KLBMP 9356]|uniref:Uncharacterized protein n=1 Tax=Nocardioides potassii TaxID=2911371 RepID=A0ABS9H6S4_9ACTN|nr:hypothetical protein [Nocardioides potassii]MCF6376931.1 hypothetical protein [Nocardioides potassii]
MRVFTAHDPEAGASGTDYLISIFDDGTGEFATRPGKDQRLVTWSPPTPLRAEA